MKSKEIFSESRKRAAGVIRGHFQSIECLRNGFLVLVLFLGFNGFLIGSLAVAGCCSALEYSRQDSTTT